MSSRRNGIGTDAVDLEQAGARGIRVTATPDVSTDDVADMAIGLMLAVARRLCIGDHFVRDGSLARRTCPAWTQGQQQTARRFGHWPGGPSRAIARRAEGFGITIAYIDLWRLEEVEYRYHPTLETLAHESDFLASGVPGSRGIVDARVLDALGHQLAQKICAPARHRAERVRFLDRRPFLRKYGEPSGRDPAKACQLHSKATHERRSSAES